MDFYISTSGRESSDVEEFQFLSKKSGGST